MNIYRNILKYIWSYGESTEDYIKKPKSFAHDNQAIKEYSQHKETLINWL